MFSIKHGKESKIIIKCGRLPGRLQHAKKASMVKTITIKNSYATNNVH